MAPAQRTTHPKGRDYGRSGRNSQDFDLNPWSDKIKKWITDKIDKNTIDFADQFGEFIAQNGLTTSQIRAFFGEMRRIQMNGYSSQKTDFLLLKAKLAYAVKRHNKPGLTKFFNFFSIAYNEVNTNDDAVGKVNFKNTMDLMEAVLAYHKYHGGKE